MRVGDLRGIASGRARTSWWAHMDVNRLDPVDLALAASLRKSALAHVAESSCGKYTDRINMFVGWCNALADPQATMPASDGIVAMYLQSVMNNAKMFAPAKAASAAVTFF